MSRSSIVVRRTYADADAHLRRDPVRHECRTVLVDQGVGTASVRVRKPYAGAMLRVVARGGELDVHRLSDDHFPPLPRRLGQGLDGRGAGMDNCFILGGGRPVPLRRGISGRDTTIS